MEQVKKAHLFVYDRKEMVILTLLGLVVGAFAFTLGVHLGKQVTLSPPAPGAPEAAVAGTQPDQLPTSQELNEQGRHAQGALENLVTQTLHEEVTKSGVQLQKARQVDLPTEAATKHGGATTLESQYVLQIGSFPEEDQAASKLKLLRGKGVKEAFAKEVNLGSKGKWYRVYVGPFTSKDLAEKSGSQYKSQRKVDSFIVTRLTTE